MGVSLDNTSAVSTSTDGISAATEAPAASDATGTAAVATPSPAPAPVDAYQAGSTGLPRLDSTTHSSARFNGEAPVSAVTTPSPSLPPEDVHFEGATTLVADVLTYGQTGSVGTVSADFRIEPEEKMGLHEVGSLAFDLFTQALRNPSGGTDFDPSSELDDPNFDISADAAFFESATKFKA